jgi:hypothetical protein
VVDDKLVLKCVGGAMNTFMYGMGEGLQIISEGSVPAGYALIMLTAVV